MVQNNVDIRDYFEILRRRKRQIILPCLLILLVSIGLAFGLPPVYQSIATVLIERQDIPQDLVRTTVGSYAAERLNIINKRVMTSANMRLLIEKYDLYPEDSSVEDIGVLISRLSDSIELTILSADVRDPASGRSGTATVSFSLSTEMKNPESAQKITDELVALYLQENINIRTKKVEITSDFLGEEAGRLGAEISILEASLATFKEKNIGRLPEQLQMNMSLLERTGRELEEAERQLYSLEENKMVFESQLGQLEPNTLDSPEGRLKELQAEYIRASAAYSPDHPDVVRLKREIEFIRKQIGGNVDRRELEEQLINVRAELAATLEKYSEDHPDVVRLRKSLAAITAAIKNMPMTSEDSDEILLEPDNPAYISANTQLEGIKIRIKAESEKRERLKEKFDKYEQRILMTPRVEQEWLILQRDYDNAIKKYQDIKEKQLRANISEQLERASIGERFSVLEPASLPIKPVKPNRQAILFLGVVLSLGGGVVYASIAEFLDRTIRGAKAVTRLLQAPPLSVIPRIENSKDAQRKRNHRLLAIGLFVLALLLGLLLIHYFWMPVDMIWSTVLNPDEIG